MQQIGTKLLELLKESNNTWANEVAKTREMGLLCDQLSLIRSEKWAQNDIDAQAHKIKNIFEEIHRYEILDLKKITKELKKSIKNIEGSVASLEESALTFDSIKPWCLWVKADVGIRDPLNYYSMAKQNLERLDLCFKNMRSYTLKNPAFNNDLEKYFANTLYRALKPLEELMNFKIEPLTNDQSLFRTNKIGNDLRSKANTIKFISNSSVALGLKILPEQTVRDYLDAELLS